MSNVLVTGAAGFIGSHLVDHLLLQGYYVTAVDNFDPFYPAAVKRQNIAGNCHHSRYELIEADIRDFESLQTRLPGRYDVIVHLAAKAGVRPSIEDPIGYLQTNVTGTQNLLELAARWKTPQFIFASSSSVYGVNPNLPWSEAEHTLLPISPYASAKVSGELLGHVYSHLYGMRFIALRLFTVYGPRQRPDLAIHKFAKLIANGEPIPVFGDGTTRRDYTYVADVVQAIASAMHYKRNKFEIFNIGNDKPVTLMKLIEALGSVLGRIPVLQYLPMQDGDVPETWARISKAARELNYRPKTPLKIGLREFVNWAELPINLKSSSEALALLKNFAKAAE